MIGTPKSKIEFEKDVTLDDVCKEADQMFAKCKDALETVTPSESHIEQTSDNLAELLWKEHKQFATAYPIVTNLMTRGYYHREAFRSFVNFIKHQTNRSEGEFLDNQAKYVKPLLRKLGIRDNRVIDTIYNNTRANLEANSRKFKSALKTAEVDVKKLEAENAAARREDLRKLLAAHPEKFAELAKK